MIPMMKRRIVIMMTLWRLSITPIGLPKGAWARRRAIRRATKKTTARVRRRAKRSGNNQSEIHSNEWSQEPASYSLMAKEPTRRALLVYADCR